MKDGGPAFPQSYYLGNPNSGYTPTQAVGGMSLRDYFAAAALQGMCASDPVVDRTKANKPAWAKAAYQFADAMLAEREKP